MVVELYEVRLVAVHRICADDDASTRSLLRWSNDDWMKNNNTTIKPRISVVTGGVDTGRSVPCPDKGRLPGHIIPEPKFVTNPNHRKKVFMKHLHALKAMKASKRCTITRMDITRLGKNLFGYMARGLRRHPEEEWTDAGKAVIEHHFDNHSHCGAWCKRKRMTEEEKLTKARYYRDLTKDAKLYGALDKVVGRFVTLDRLQEIAHGMDTQINESFNNTASWFAPKNKVYCGSSSLTNRLSLAVGINSLGLQAYFNRLFTYLGITMVPCIEHFLKVKDNTRNKRHANRKLTVTKKLRSAKKYAQLAADEVLAKKE
jgi:hypothetical protein